MSRSRPSRSSTIISWKVAMATKAARMPASVPTPRPSVTVAIRPTVASAIANQVRGRTFSLRIASPNRAANIGPDDITTIALATGVQASAST